MSGDVNAAAETIRQGFTRATSLGPGEAQAALDALVAEVERLQAEREDYCEWSLRMKAELAAARTDASRKDLALVALRDEKQQLEADIERRKLISADDWQQNQRLQEALREIHEFECGCSKPGAWEGCLGDLPKCREALEGSQPAEEHGS